jgi:putative flavoprotein involved in K+ transport
MQLHGRLVDIQAGRAELADDLAQQLDNADAVADSIKDSIDRHIAAGAITAPAEPRYRPVWRPAAGSPLLDLHVDRRLDLAAAGISAVVWCTGFRSDWSWVDVPIFDGRGYPSNTRGVTAAAGLYVLGLPWLHTWGSGRFSAVGADAEYLAEQIAGAAARDRPAVSHPADRAQAAAP